MARSWSLSWSDVQFSLQSTFHLYGPCYAVGTAISLPQMEFSQADTNIRIRTDIPTSRHRTSLTSPSKVGALTFKSGRDQTNVLISPRTTHYTFSAAPATSHKSSTVIFRLSKTRRIALIIPGP